MYFGGHELVKVGDRFVIKKLGEAVSVIIPSVRTIDRSYIVSISERYKPYLIVPKERSVEESRSSMKPLENQKSNI